MSSTAIPATDPVSFPLFSNLPLELRNEIWKYALLEKDIPALFPYEIGCWHPLLLSEASADNIRLEFNYTLLEPIPLEVPIYFVNCEARGVALAWARDQGVRTRFCQEVQNHVFVRRFDNEQDTLYVVAD